MRGHPQKKKTLAKCSAAYEMCLELRRKGYLDASLLPTYVRQLPAMRNALLAISPNKKDMYEMRIKPDYWKYGFDTVPDELYLTFIDVSAGLERPHQPIGLITRRPFPQMPEFPIYLSDGTPSQVISVPMAQPFSATEDLKIFTDVTLQVYRDIFAKVFEHDVTKMSYWLVPLRTDGKTPATTCEYPEDLIDWEQVREISEKKQYIWKPDNRLSDDFLANKYIVDPNDGGRRFYSRAVAPQYKPTDPVPDTAPNYKYMKNILDYSVSLWTKSRVKQENVWDRSQPVLEVEKIPFRRNFLAHVEKDEENEVKWNPVAYICPEPMDISALSTRFVAMCYVFPAIIHRFEAYLVALDACTKLDLNIGPRLALEALTKDSDNSEEHGQEQVRFKSGMGPNYERLEFMGDCFLKMATSISTFVLQPEENEFEFHVRRMLMLCNKNLFKTALKLELYEYVRTMAFSRRTWYPEGLKMLKGKGMKMTGPRVIKHQLGDKSIADVCEAFIGAAFMEHNDRNEWVPEKWDQAVKSVKTMVDNEDHQMETWADYYAAYTKPKYQLAEATASQLDLARKIEQKHPYHFRYPRLLRSAFIHPSQAFMWENIPNYQRLEFLGDALLDQVFIMHIFYKYPDKDPQWLTEHKMPMVANKFLGALCVSLGFHTHIRQNNPALTTKIHDYVVEVQDAEREANGALDYWVHVSEPPKCLADVVEAFVAAMFVDSQFDFRVVQHFFDRHIACFFVDMALYDDFANNHPVTRLRNLFAVGFGCQDARMGLARQQSVVPGAKEQCVAMVMIHDRVCFHALSSSGRYGRLRVAEAALEKLEGLPPFEFRRVYGCDCEDDEGVGGNGNGNGNGAPGTGAPGGSNSESVEEMMRRASLAGGNEDEDGMEGVERGVQGDGADNVDIVEDAIRRASLA
jgi:endoribonuclease Dicer